MPNSFPTADGWANRLSGISFISGLGRANRPTAQRRFLPSYPNPLWPLGTTIIRPKGPQISHVTQSVSSNAQSALSHAYEGRKSGCQEMLRVDQ